MNKIKKIQFNNYKLTSDNHKNRLMCAVASKNNIGFIDNSSLEKSLKKLKHRLYLEAKNLRKEKGYNEGRTYGFYIQQYMNCEIALNK